MSIVRQESRPIENDEEGAYLTFDTSSQGTLILTWTKHSVPNALMHFTPRKSVPAFKYSTNQGRTELIRNCQGDTRRYYQGFCAFLKAVKAFDGEVTLIDNDGPIKIQVWLHIQETNKIIKINKNKSYSLINVDSVAVTPLDYLPLDTKILTTNLFKEKAERVGAYLMIN